MAIVALCSNLDLFLMKLGAKYDVRKILHTNYLIGYNSFIFSNSLVFTSFILPLITISLLYIKIPMECFKLLHNVVKMVKRKKFNLMEAKFYCTYLKKIA